MLSGFGTKVLLMHMCFLALRVFAWPLLEIGPRERYCLALTQWLCSQVLGQRCCSCTRASWHSECSLGPYLRSVWAFATWWPWRQRVRLSIGAFISAVPASALTW